MENSTSCGEASLEGPIGTPEGEESPKSGGTCIDLLSSRRLRKMTLNLFLCWFVNAFVYYGLSLSAQDIGGEIFINFAIAGRSLKMFSWTRKKFLEVVRLTTSNIVGAVEIPAYALSIIVLLYTGRRFPLSAAMIIGGSACLLALLVPKGVYYYDWPVVTLAMVGKFGISSSFAIVYVFTAELMPTPVRTVGLGACSTFARLGSILAPYILLLGEAMSHVWLPICVFGISSLISGLLLLLLPETAKRRLPETIHEAKNISKYQVVSVRCTWKSGDVGDVKAGIFQDKIAFLISNVTRKSAP
ncbi:unnamed protein product [Darwinula stevensoni]|uniref:Uncharacterized protein n=1 Tax=Darwinula stevensoni TaxID=69355 RepID=A0A7R8X3B8_9CRUS|nr:unnamed protein product [Darwinula stevensoni]CAG0878579.1 unnamed protein product [Darwinula stevensoni]